MDDDYIACPQDPELRFLRSFCAAYYRNSVHHYWCRQCPHFNESEPGTVLEAGTQREHRCQMPDRP